MVTHPLRAGPSPPGSHHLRVVLLIATPPLIGSEPHGPERPDPGFRFPQGQHNRRAGNRSTNRRNPSCHRFYDSNRYTTRRHVITIWHGTWIIATRNVLNSIRNSDRFSA